LNLGLSAQIGLKARKGEVSMALPRSVPGGLAVASAPNEGGKCYIAINGQTSKVHGVYGSLEAAIDEISSGTKDTDVEFDGTDTWKYGNFTIQQSVYHG
jgi:ethanolamine utilization microcompartment shell protein EutL